MNLSYAVRRKLIGTVVGASMVLSATATTFAQDSTAARYQFAYYLCYGQDAKTEMTGEKTAAEYRKEAEAACAGVCAVNEGTTDSVGKCGVNSFAVGLMLRQPGANLPTAARPVPATCDELLKLLSTLDTDTGDYADKKRMYSIRCSNTNVVKPSMSLPSISVCDQLMQVYERLVASLNDENNDKVMKEITYIKEIIARCRSNVQDGVMGDALKEPHSDQGKNPIPCFKNQKIDLIVCQDGTTVDASGAASCMAPKAMTPGEGRKVVSDVRRTQLRQRLVVPFRAVERVQQRANQRRNSSYIQGTEPKTDDTNPAM